MARQSFPFSIPAGNNTFARSKSVANWRAHAASCSRTLVGCSSDIYACCVILQDMPGYENSRAILASVSNAVARKVSFWRSNGCTARSFKFATMNSWPVTVDAVALSLAMNLRINIKPLTGLYHGIDPADEIDRVIDTADFVILAKSDKIPWLPASWLPGSKFSSHTSARLASDAKWHLISSTSEYELFAITECR